MQVDLPGGTFCLLTTSFLLRKCTDVGGCWHRLPVLWNSINSLRLLRVLAEEQLLSEVFAVSWPRWFPSVSQSVFGLPLPVCKQRRPLCSSVSCRWANFVWCRIDLVKSVQHLKHLFIQSQRGLSQLECWETTLQHEHIQQQVLVQSVRFTGRRL